MPQGQADAQGTVLANRITYYMNIYSITSFRIKESSDPCPHSA